MLIASAMSCSRVPSTSGEPLNVLIVLVDTLRYDRLGSYDGKRQLTPFLDSLAGRGYVFERAYATSSWTNPSVASLFTSRYQSEHHVISFGSTLAAEEVTLAEVLKRHGYATGAFCANILVNERLGFSQGFDHFQNVSRPGKPGSFSRILKGRADAVNREVLSWLDSLSPDGNKAPPYFLYVHYMEPHAPFDPPDPYLTKVLDGRPRSDPDEINKAVTFAVVTFPEELLGPVQDYYDAEVMSLDAQIEDLFAQLQSRGHLDNTLVVFVADHGEEFYEHGLVGHHQTLYEEVIRIPFILALPGQKDQARISELVSLVDVAPTVLDLAGLPRAEEFEGRTLTPLLDVAWLSHLRELLGQNQARPVFSELIKAEETVRKSPHERAVLLDLDKLIVGVDGSRQYYDLAKDPHEKHPQSTSTDGEALNAALQSLFAEGTKRGSPKKGAVDAETRERMRALGYVE